MGSERGETGNSTELKEKIRTLKSELEQQFVERDDEIAGALLGLLAGEHLLFLGPPGTAKSLLATKVCDAVDGGRFFYYLLTRFTTPDEVFGPLSIKSLQEDRFHRVTDKALPAADIAFLDEIFKANSSILNSLLTILNERKFHNGQEVINVPLLSVFGASNELPEEEEKESLQALYDRFLFRYSVKNVQEEANFKELVFGDAEGYKPSVTISVEEIRRLQKEAKATNVDEDVTRIVTQLRKLFQTEKLSISDRRWKKIIRVLKVAAAALGRSSVDRTMALITQHMLWDEPEQRDRIRNLVVDLTISGGVSLDRLGRDVEDLRREVGTAEDDKMPAEIQCFDCYLKLTTWSQVNAHKAKQPTHRFRLPDAGRSW